MTLAGYKLAALVYEAEAQKFILRATSTCLDDKVSLRMTMSSDCF